MRGDSRSGPRRGMAQAWPWHRRNDAVSLRRRPVCRRAASAGRRHAVDRVGGIRGDTVPRAIPARGSPRCPGGRGHPERARVHGRARLGELPGEDRGDRGVGRATGLQRRPRDTAGGAVGAGRAAGLRRPYHMVHDRGDRLYGRAVRPLSGRREAAGLASSAPCGGP